MSVDLEVNGRRMPVDVDPATPLLWVLRETLALTGTKYGCGAAQCGACTVHLDGNAVRSCVLPVSAAAGRRVTTIEGLAGGAADALKQAWTELDVPQCGYCQTGQIMSAAVLLREQAVPSDADIDACMAGNVCRCATYVRIRSAIHRAAALAAGTAPPLPAQPAGGAR
jgi:isoquinoline 1-oxidoreductase subunit alpha